MPKSAFAAFGWREGGRYLQRRALDAVNYHLRDAVGTADFVRRFAQIDYKRAYLAAIIRVYRAYAVYHGYAMLKREAGSGAYLRLVSGRDRDTKTKRHSRDFAGGDCDRYIRVKIHPGGMFGRVFGCRQVFCVFSWGYLQGYLSQLMSLPSYGLYLFFAFQEENNSQNDRNSRKNSEYWTCQFCVRAAYYGYYTNSYD